MGPGLSAPIPGLPEMRGDGPYNVSIADTVVVPAHLAPGRYTLSWRWDARSGPCFASPFVSHALRWDAEQSKQVWAHCSDVVVVASGDSSTESSASDGEDGARSPSVYEQNKPTRHVCIGDSIGLDTLECDAWVDLYDALGGPHWYDPADGPDACPGLRLNPCGCQYGVWGVARQNTTSYWYDCCTHALRPSRSFDLTRFSPALQIYSTQANLHFLPQHPAPF
jgi:hypothetical protein